MRLISLLFTTGVIIFNTYNAKAQITPWEAASEMKKGINLGNTMEPPTEAGWNNPKAQEYYFDLYKAAGFNCVRIPVRWDNYTSKTFPYKISDAWLNRVEQVVDWGLSRGLFIVINSHHDDWIKNNYTDPNMRERFDSIWSQIATRFRNKSDSLLFEVLNEPYGLTKSQNDDMHQRIISIIRKTNPTRIIIFQGNNWGGSDDLLNAAIPDDHYVMGSFHSYNPYNFAQLGEGTWGSEQDINTLRDEFIKVKNWSDENNIPVFLGEFGAVRSCDYNSRMKLYKYYVHFAREYGFVSCAWDDGGNYKILNRQARTWDEVKDILIYGSPKSPDNLKLSVYQDSIVKLTWNNMVTDNDSIYIERRKSTDASYKKIAAISNKSYVFYDIKPDTNITWHYRVIAHYNDTADVYSYPQRIFFPGYVIPEQETFYDSPAVIPGVIEAEDFDKGGEGVAYHDSDNRNDGGAYRPDEAVDIFQNNGGYILINNLPGEWYEYTVDVQQERTYDITFNLATPQPGGKFMLQIGNVRSDTLVAASSGSWTETVGVTTSMKLKAGEQVMRFTVIDSPPFNFDSMNFTLKTGSALVRENINHFNVFIGDNNKLVVRLNQPGQLNQIKLYDITGSTIKTILNPEPVTEMNLNMVPPGIYIIQAQFNMGTYSRKIVIH